MPHVLYHAAFYLTMNTAIKILTQTNSTATVGGYGVVFGGVDLDGETFTSETDFMLDYVPQKRVLYEHAMNERIRNAPIGTVKSVTPDEIGLFVEAELSKSADYWAGVNQLIEAGKIGWSSGSIEHMTARENGVIKSWPIVEFSLTPRPAEVRTIGVQNIKHVIQPEISTQAEAASKTAPDVPTPDLTTAAIAARPAQTAEVNKMTEEIKTEKAVEPVNIAGLEAAIKSLTAKVDAIENTPINEPGVKSAPVVLKHGRGDTEGSAFKAFLGGSNGTEFTVKASNATDMNIGTAADGGNAVPTGFYNQIIARRDESMLSARLPIMRVPGVGTTVDVPLDGEADGEFVATSEASTMDLDSPAIGKKSLTLAKYTKRMLLSYELLEDTPTAIESFLADFVGRGMAKTHNSLLLTEVATNGTLLKTFAAQAAIAFGEPEDIVGNNDLAAYMDDDAAIAWVMRNSTKWDINSLVGDARQYSANGDNANTLLGYPVYTSQKAAAPATSAKSVYFGNWSYVAMREAPGITFQRDPYSNADTGQLTLRWWFRTVYGVLQAEAIGYAAQAGA